MGRTNEIQTDPTTTLESRVALLVPGYTGYARVAERRDSDGRIRVEACERIDASTARLEDFLLEISEDGWTAGVEGIDRTIRRLEELRDAVTCSADAYRGFLSLGDLPERRSTPLMELDLALLFELDAFGEYVENLGTPHFTTGLRKETLGQLDRRLADIEATVERRMASAREIGDEGDG